MCRAHCGRVSVGAAGFHGTSAPRPAPPPPRAPRPVSRGRRASFPPRLHSEAPVRAGAGVSLPRSRPEAPGPASQA